MKSISDLDRRAIEAKRLVAARETMGWKRRELAKLAGIHETNLRAMEAGERNLSPGLLDWIEKLASFFKAHPLVSGEPRRRGPKTPQAPEDQLNG